MTLLNGNDSTPAMNLPHASDATDETVVFSPIKRRWPVKDEYDLAIANWHSTVFDPEIRTGQLARDNHGIYTYGGANLYICIYRVSDWMVRFFCTNPNHPTPSDIQERYKAIARFCNSHTLSCLLPIKYVERGILVGGNREFPLIKMPFLGNCPPLGEFIINNYQESEVMHRLCDAWVGMMHELEDAQIAHGDLDLTNVLVQEQDQQITLKLIDYDNMWIPALRGRSQTEYGHATSNIQLSCNSINDLTHRRWTVFQPLASIFHYALLLNTPHSTMNMELMRMIVCSSRSKTIRMPDWLVADCSNFVT